MLATEDVPFYVLKSSHKGVSRNCTLTAIYPAVVSLLGVHIGHGKGPNYDVSGRLNWGRKIHLVRVNSLLHFSVKLLPTS